MTDDSSISLDGVWDAYPDPDGIGIEQAWFTSPPASVEPIDLPVPSAWQHVIPDDGPDVVWYHKSIAVPDGMDCESERLWLVFDAVSTATRVWINGLEVGRADGDWMPFQFDFSACARAASELDIWARVDRVRPEPEVWTDGHPMQAGHLTKGFHDVTSMQHAGIWQSVRLERSGAIRPIPDGLQLRAEASGQLEVWCEFEPHASSGRFEVEVVDQDGVVVSSAECGVDAGAGEARIKREIASASLWSPDNPVLYTLRASIECDGNVDRFERRFGFRTVCTGGASGRSIIFNGSPMYISAVLDWGHEPQHIAPAAPVDEYRARLDRLKAMGFNCICLCMWYPPKWFQDLCDEIGMLIWQEHPVWKTDMSDDRLDEYKRQYPRFFRRDQSHPSVVIVSGSCEHHAFNPKLADWWWTNANERMPDRLLQMQTAFIDWTELDKTDMYDEHVYESSGRWTRYLRDLEADLAGREPKPLVMGESVLYVSWPDIPASEDGGRPCWSPAAADELARVEATLAARYGDQVGTQLRARAHRSHIQGRQYQTEAARSLPDLAGLVQNHIRDVMICPCGLMDDAGHWRFADSKVRTWAAPSIFILEPPDNLRGLPAGNRITLRLGVSNYGHAPVSGQARVTAEMRGVQVLDANLQVDAERGEVSFIRYAMNIPECEEPTEITVRASLEGVEPNEWSVWAIPRIDTPPSGVARLSGYPFTMKEREPSFEERRYSSGWGLEVATWKSRHPNLSVILPSEEAIDDNAGIPESTRVLLTHRLTPAVTDWLVSGGRVLLLASNAEGCPPTTFLTHFGQVPFVPSTGPFEGLDTTWVGDLIDPDLTFDHVRSVRTSELEIADLVQPIVRLLYLHDTSTPMKIYDSVFAAHVGEGRLCVSSLDHYQAAGQYLLGRLLHWLAAAGPEDWARLDVDLVSSWTSESTAGSREQLPAS